MTQSGCGGSSRVKEGVRSGQLIVGVVIDAVVKAIVVVSILAHFRIDILMHKDWLVLVS